MLSFCNLLFSILHNISYYYLLLYICTMNNYIYFDRQCHDCILGETASRFGSLIGIRILFGYNISRNLFPVVPLAST